MDHIINIKAVGERLKKKPRGQRLYHFFLGVPKQLTKEEIKELKKVINAENKKINSYLDKAEALIINRSSEVERSVATGA